MRRRRVKAARIAALLAGAAIVLLALAQLFLPALAANHIRSRIDRYGTVKTVHVSAWPAVKLLWGDADSVDVDAGALALSTREAAARAWEGRSVARLDFHASSVLLGGLQLTEATLRKRGKTLEAHALASREATQAALPPGVRVELLRSSAGKVEVRAGGGLFGVEAAVDAVAEASHGRLVAHPLGLLLEGFQLTLFSDPHVDVEGIGASTTNALLPTYRLSMRASLR